MFRGATTPYPIRLMKKILPFLACLLLGLGTACAQTYDQWRAQKFSPAEAADESISGRLADPDRDGKSNYLEYATGTDPLTPDAAGQASGAMDEFGRLRLSFLRRTAAPGTVYLPQVSTDLKRWRSGEFWFDELSATALNAELNSIVVAETFPPANAARRFLRLCVAADVNGNGIPDEWELAHGFSLTDPEAIHRDSDGDGVTDGQELMDGTDPFDYYNGARRPGIPAAPANVRVTGNPDGSRTVEWDDVSDNEQWFIIYDDLPGGGQVEVGRVGPNQTSFRIPPPAQP